MRKLLFVLMLLGVAVTANAQTRNSKYVGEASVGGLWYSDNAFFMSETVHGARLTPSFFVGGGTRITFHNEHFDDPQGKENVNTTSLALFGDVKFYITPDKTFCPYVDMQAGAQAVFGPSSSAHYSMDGSYMRPMVGGGLGFTYGRFNFGVYVAVNFEVSEGGVKLGVRF